MPYFQIEIEMGTNDGDKTEKLPKLYPYTDADKSEVQSNLLYTMIGVREALTFTTPSTNLQVNSIDHPEDYEVLQTAENAHSAFYRGEKLETYKGPNSMGLCLAYCEGHKAWHNETN